jgi:hypothetical protein
MAEDKKSEVQITDREARIYREKSLCHVWALSRAHPLTLTQLSKIKSMYDQYLQLVENAGLQRDQPVLKEIYVSLPCLREHAEELRQKLQQILSEG